MGRKFAISYEERISAVEKYLRDESSMSNLSKQFNVDETTIMRWITRYQYLGPEGIQENPRNQAYSSELKEAAVLDYLSGVSSQWALCTKYGIKSICQLR